MVDERRKPEASALRRLFHEQFTHLLEVAEVWNRQWQVERQKEAEISQAIESVVTGTDARMRSVGSYKKRLRESVHSVLDYVNTLVDGLPAAIAVNQQSFASDPQVNSFFVNKHEVQTIFSQCRELHAFFEMAEHSNLQQAYALLFVRKSEKTIFGKSLCDDEVLSDVKQTSVSFSEHQLLSPCATEELVRKSLKALLFDSIVEYIKYHMTQQCYQQLQDEQIQKNLRLDLSLKNPEIYLQTLIEQLNEPLVLLNQQESMLKISKMGIRLGDEPNVAANELRLHELQVGNRPSRIITLVRYPKSELLPLPQIFDRR